jgi:hypothetical protein
MFALIHIVFSDTESLASTLARPGSTVGLTSVYRRSSPEIQLLCGTQTFSFNTVSNMSIIGLYNVDLMRSQRVVVYVGLKSLDLT